MQLTDTPTRRRAVFLDIDGTLTDSRGEVPDDARAAIHEAQATGHHVLLATGRSPLEIDPRVEEVGFDGLIAGAGAYVIYEEQLLLEHELPEAEVRAITAILDEMGVDYSIQGRRGVYPTEGHRNRMRRLLTEFGFTDLETSGLRFHVLDPGEMRYDRASKLVFDGDDPATSALVKERLGDRYAIVGGTLPGLGSASGEISPAGVHKAAAIEVVLERLGLTMADAVAVGDSGNDVEMLDACGVGVAMGNGTDEAKAAADVVTEGVEDSGLWNAFARLGLIAGPVRGGDSWPAGEVGRIHFTHG